MRRRLPALICCIAATAASVHYLDHPLADFFAARVAHTAVGWWLNRLLGLLVFFPVAALMTLFAGGCWMMSGRKLAPWTRPFLACAWSAIWALAAEFAFKQVFARLPAGGPHAGHFPSGTATISAAAATTIWLVVPRWRMPGLVVAAFASIAVVATNGHWLSDVIAGAFLGWSIGWMTVLLLNPVPRASGRDDADANAR